MDQELRGSEALAPAVAGAAGDSRDGGVNSQTSPPITLSKLKPRWNLHFRDDEGQAKVLGEGFQPAHKAGPLLPLSLLNMHIPPWH